jgi:hypothetical protein
MKILVDAKELDKAFNAVANAKNHFTRQSYAIQQLQIACDILGPMWTNGVDENKKPISSGEWIACKPYQDVNRQAILEILEMLIEYGDSYNETREHTQLHNQAEILKAKLVGE